MSSKARNITKQPQYQNQFIPLELTLIGSIIATTGKLVGRTKEQSLADFHYYEKHFDELEGGKETTTIKELCDFFVEKYNVPENYKNYIILLTDKRKRMTKTPLVTLCTDDYKILPIGNDLVPKGLIMEWYRLAEDASDSIDVEFVYR